jgi:hypothetical protein
MKRRRISGDNPNAGTQQAREIDVQRNWEDRDSRIERTDSMKRTCLEGGQEAGEGEVDETGEKSERAAAWLIEPGAEHGPRTWQPM